MHRRLFLSVSTVIAVLVNEVKNQLLLTSHALAVVSLQVDVTKPSVSEISWMCLPEKLVLYSVICTFSSELESQTK